MMGAGIGAFFRLLYKNKLSEITSVNGPVNIRLENLRGAEQQVKPPVGCGPHVIPRTFKR